MHTAVIGTQWGDEGKGKIVDFLAQEHDIIVRCQGGNNAGHTVVLNGQKFPFHLLPSAVLHPDKICVLGNGMVINPEVLVQELNNLKSKVGDQHAQVLISNRAHVITPEHIQIDLEKNKHIGTTGRGIGPSYSHKINRLGKRFHEFHLIDDYSPAIKEQLLPLIFDTGVLLNLALEKNKRILFEGAQATMLDIDHGTYPYVTSSNCSIGGIFTGTGVFVKEIKVIGVAKAYTTRVGNGPFVTELMDDIGGQIREKGQEYGTTTGRPRRCGWLDTIVLRYAKRINHLDSIALTKLDVLGGLKEVRICDAYIHEGKKIHEFPAETKILDTAVPEYIVLPGWEEDISHCKSFAELPANAKYYVRRIEELTGVKVEFVGVGANRSEIVCKSE